MKKNRNHKRRKQRAWNEERGTRYGNGFTRGQGTENIKSNVIFNLIIIKQKKGIFYEKTYFNFFNGMYVFLHRYGTYVVR